ncbi:MAG: type IV pilus assembly protein PilM, partial [Phycisphaerales bacterium]|nr:type IV pilus assembly protein PilM [Phycisphaerales bacterium]
MAAKQPIWGIDVGQCSLKAIKLQAVGPDEFELLAFDIVEHAEILSQSEADATDLVAEAIAKFAERNDTSRSKLVIAVPGQQTLTKFTKMPPVERKKIPDMVQYEASQQIPFDMDEVVWDYQIFGESEGTTEIEVGIFAIRKELIRNYLMLYTEAGLEPAMVQTSPIASYNTARFEMPMPEGEAAVLLDMGAVATDLIIIDGDRIWSRPVPIGGNKFTEALVSAFKIAFKKAEKLKRNAAASRHAKQIFQAMRPVFADLVSEVQRSIGFYTSTHRDTNITKVIGMGNAFKLPGLQKFLQQNLQMEVTKLTGFKHLRPAQVEKKDDFNDNIMSMAVCYGLALQGMELAKVESNLLPVEFRRHVLWQKKRPWFAGAAAMLALGAGAIWASNLSASGTISGAIGNDQGEVPRAKSFPNDEAAMRAVEGARSIAQPLDKAATVAGAAAQLKASFSKADQQSKNAGTINLLA